MADKRIGELSSAVYVYDDTLLAAEQQGQAVKITVGQLRGGSGETAGGSGVGRPMSGETVEPARGETVTAQENAEIFNDYRERTFDENGEADTGNIASGAYSHAEGCGTTASGRRSHAENGFTTASNDAAHAEGFVATASGRFSHAEGGRTAASGEAAHAEGIYTAASDEADHAEGRYTTASGMFSHAEGYGTSASGQAAHAEGFYTKASGNLSHAGGAHAAAAALGQTAIGGPNVISTNNSDEFIIGNGSYNMETVLSRSNCFRVTSASGVYAKGSYNSSGADYAEMFEWADGNLCNEDRTGRFVTLDGAKIRIAQPGDDYVLGVVSGNPSVVGDVYDDQWQGMYLRDIYGKPIWENAEGFDHAERRQKLNPNYDSTQKYTPRSDRPEWATVGMLGKLVAVDDGSCMVNGWCAVGVGGIATASESRTKYRVMERLEENHIRVMIL